jgi:hypothetical protein
MLVREHRFSVTGNALSYFIEARLPLLIGPDFPEAEFLQQGGAAHDQQPPMSSDALEPFRAVCISLAPVPAIEGVWAVSVLPMRRNRA